MAVGIAQSCAKNRFRFSMLLCLNFIVGIILFILSMLQTTSQGKTSNGKQWSKQCNEEETLQFVTPFRAELEDDSFISCPWPIVNTAFRATLTLVVPILVVVLLITLRKLHWTVSWILCRYVMLLCSGGSFAVFILDCDHLRTGFTLCNNNFKIDGTQVIQTNSKIKHCWLTPYVWTILVDIILFFLSTWAYLTMQFYPYFRATGEYKTKKGLETVPDDDTTEEKAHLQKRNSKSSFASGVEHSNLDDDKNVDKTLLPPAEGGEPEDRTEPNHRKAANSNSGAYGQ